MSITRPEFGLICDRTEQGLGRQLLRTALGRELIDTEESCDWPYPHRHELCVRLVTLHEWEPLSGIGNFVGGES